MTERRLMELATTATTRARDAVASATGALSSGVAVGRASDDPVRWAQGKVAQARAAVSAGHARSIDVARGQLDQADGALDSVGEVLRRAQELGTQMATGVMSATERAGAAEEVGQLRQTLIGLLDSRAGDGEYLFAGAGGDVAPFDAAGAYVGTADVRAVVSGEALTQLASLPGATFTAANGVDILATLDGLATSLAADDQAGVQGWLDPVAAAIDQVAGARTTIGVRLEALDQAEQARGGLALGLAEELDRAVAADPIAAASRLTQAATALEGARAAAARIVALLNQGG
ncbi:MAG: hypothetical protein H6709_21030 [Kofleriaceae bacterium]|nr:hypothetical protein [Myxococcales bacterium]MCB9562634.1 hypothetical protein [Kofleriaceae bacterium]MCB9574568.1 hypothetical protein [Kofleriaceae bacterium]